jgi:hypothetical protein
MGKRYTVEIERTRRASRDVAFHLLRDAESWASWAGGAVRFSEWEGGPLLDELVAGPEDSLTVRWSGQFEERIPGSSLLERAAIAP